MTDGSAPVHDEVVTGPGALAAGGAAPVAAGLRFDMEEEFIEIRGMDIVTENRLMSTGCRATGKTGGQFS